MAKPKDTNSNSLDLADLRGSLENAIIFPDSHFGLKEDLWKNAQRIADLLPVDVQVFGDLEESTVLDLIEKAKGAELQQKNWGEYSASVSRYLKALKKIREKQSEIAENASEALLELTEIESELSKTLAGNESKRRQVIASNRSAIANAENELSISLNRIASQYTETVTKRTQSLTEEKTKEQTPVAKQTESLVERFRKARESRHSGIMTGITQRAKVS